MYADDVATFGQYSKSLFTSALLGPENGRSSPQDTWDHMRIPLLASLPGYASNLGSQRYLIPNNTKITYSSLVGLPMLSSAGTSNASFTFNTSYWSMDCPSMGFLHYSTPQGANHTSVWDSIPPIQPYNLSVPTAETFNISAPQRPYVIPGAPLLPNNSIPTVVQSRNASGSMMYSVCTGSRVFVEVETLCVSHSCSAAAIRQVEGPSNFSIWINGPATGLAFQALSTVYAVNHGAQTTPMEQFLAGGQVTDLQWPDYSNVTAADISLRFTQLINSWWMAEIAPTAVLGLPDVTSLGGGGNGVHWNGKVLDSHEVFVCHKSWLAVLFLASTTVLLAGTMNLIFNLMRQGPDILDSFSTLTRDNPFILDGILHGSNVDGAERARKLANIRVQLGDVANEKEFGHIAIGSTKDGRVAPLKRGRLYD